jgi:hypothetical protein
MKAKKGDGKLSAPFVSCECYLLFSLFSTIVLGLILAEQFKHFEFIIAEIFASYLNISTNNERRRYEMQIELC